MVRSVLSLSVLLSVVVLAGLWALDDPQPWIATPVEPAEPPAAAPLPRESRLRETLGIEPRAAGTPLLEVPCVGASLLGTLVGDTGELSFAAVELGDRVITATFGDALSCGVISGIEPDRVLLKGKNGERVVMVRAQGGAAAPPRVAVSADAPSVRHHSDGVYELKRSEVEEMFVSPTTALMTTRLMPTFEKGAVSGYRIQFPGASPLASLGLRSGDVLRRVNGVTLDGPGASLDAFQRIREYGTGELEVLRGGAQVKLRYVLR